VGSCELDVTAQLLNPLSPFSTINPLHNNPMNFGEFEKLQNMTVTRPFSYNVILSRSQTPSHRDE
jgi:hypothetical protein